MKAYPILWDTGVFLPEQKLWLDPARPRPRAVISHAHSDHVAAHPHAYVTPPTRRLITHRRPSQATLEAVPYGQPFAIEKATLTFYPAGHVLGSAQTMIETGFGRILYTGDLKTRNGFTAAPACVVPADVLVIESTFGKPRYIFPDSREVIDSLIAWCRQTLDLRKTPVLLGYSLGKGQEILSGLASAGFAIHLHPTLHGVTDVYRELGCDFPAYRRLGDAAVYDGVAICPPQARRGRLVQSLGAVRTAALTGWAMDRSLKDRLEVDAVFPLSDHADFTELCAHAEGVGAAMTYTVLGFEDDLALALRRRGLRAKPLRDPDQLSLL